MNIHDFTIERIADPAAFHDQYADELAMVGADAFAQPQPLFAPQVAERFQRSQLAQIMRYGPRIAGFALFDVIRSRHWQRAVD